MIVCSCHAVSDRALRQLVASGASPEEIAILSGAGTTCGCCQPAIALLLAEEQAGAACDSASPCPGCPRRAPALQAA